MAVVAVGEQLLVLEALFTLLLAHFDQVYGVGVLAQLSRISFAASIADASSPIGQRS